MLPHEAHDPRIAAAWWCAVVEPGDLHATALRRALGEEEAVAWALAPQPGPLPADVERDPRGRPRGWEDAWQRWHARAVVADPGHDLAELDSLGGHLLLPGERGWPPGLDDLGAGAPHALWVLGGTTPATAVAVVGARASTAYGNRVAADLGLELAETGIDIVSGGAFGIDASAHRGALAAHGGRTTAVMAGGLGHLYPSAHVDLLQEIARRGAVISEVPPSWRPAKWRFLGRNRVIAALAAATVVVEASSRSGALSTARRAQDMARHVGAVPGPVSSSSSRGCHVLIREGATLVQGSRDVLEMVSSLALLAPGPAPGAPVAPDSGTDALPPAQRRVWEALPKRSGTSLEPLVRAAGLSEVEVLGALARLELEGLVVAHQLGWARARPRE